MSGESPFLEMSRRIIGSRPALAAVMSAGSSELPSNSSSWVASRRSCVVAMISLSDFRVSVCPVLGFLARGSSGRGMLCLSQCEQRSSKRERERERERKVTRVWRTLKRLCHVFEPLKLTRKKKVAQTTSKRGCSCRSHFFGGNLVELLTGLQDSVGRNVGEPAMPAGIGTDTTLEYHVSAQIAMVDSCQGRCIAFLRFRASRNHAEEVHRRFRSTHPPIPTLSVDNPTHSLSRLPFSHTVECSHRIALTEWHL
jgi:hypothetical protein